MEPTPACRYVRVTYDIYICRYKPKVSFAEYSLFYRAILQKRPVILSSLLTVATTYGLYRHMYISYLSVYTGGATIASAHKSAMNGAKPWGLVLVVTSCFDL